MYFLELIILNKMSKNLSVLEQLCYSTTRMTCELEDGCTSTGTAFFFKFPLPDNHYIPIVVTNKHVVHNAKKGLFKLTIADAENNPLNSEHFEYQIETDFEKMWIMHPDDNVDLCILPLSQLIRGAQALGKNLFFRTLDTTMIPSMEVNSQLDVVEDLFMIGYPDGVWDSKNNMPIIRKGITATHPNIDYEGEKIFLIDASCFPGSSGSPVIIYNSNEYTVKDRTTYVRSRLIFLGILYAVHLHTVTGDVQVVKISDIPKIQAESMIPNNLGYVIKSSRIQDFEGILMDIYNKK